MLHNLKSLRSQLAYVRQALRLVWAATQGWTLAWGGLLIVQGLAAIATVYWTRALVNSLVQAVNANGRWVNTRPTLFLIGIMIGLLLLTEVARSLVNWVRTVQAELVQDHVSRLIHDKALAVDLAFYDSPDYYDRLHRARVDASHRPFGLLENLGHLLQNSLTFIAMAAVLLPFGLWLPVILLLSTLPALVMVVRTTLREHQWRLRTTADQRRTRYYDWLLTDRAPAAELRLFAGGAHFQAAFQTLRQRLRHEQSHLAREQALGDVVASSLGLLVSGLALAWMVWRAGQGFVTLGDLALFYQAFSQGQQRLQTLLTNVGQLYRHSLFLEHLFEFLTLKPQVLGALGTPPPSVLPVVQIIPTPALTGSASGAHVTKRKAMPGIEFQEGIRFADVSFRYPGSERLALDNFNLWIPAGQIVAIVGENGAGKSTLIKLLCRFYDPEQGTILFDGVDLRTWSPAQVWPLVTVLFQQPVRYQATAAENIALGAWAAQPTRAMLEQAAQAAGAAHPIAKLPQGYDSLLGKWFGGAELSGGEWQRVALARAFLRQAPLIILDEPTSAMDAWAEADWMARFRQLAAGRTAIVITHRFTTAMQADMIHLMAHGQVVESGSHAQLLGGQGCYAQSWQQQMQQNQIQSKPVRQWDRETVGPYLS